MKAWITKYALTKGVYKIEAQWIGDEPDLIFGSIRDGYPSSYFRQPEWFDNPEEARTYIEEMISRKIGSLERQASVLYRKRANLQKYGLEIMMAEQRSQPAS